MSSIVSTIKVSDVPAASKFSTTGVIQEIAYKDLTGFYDKQVSFGIEYADEKTGSVRKFPVRINLRSEWFTTEFVARYKAEQVPENEATTYRINMGGLVRGLFTAAGLEDFDFDQLQGKTVGFSTKARKDDPGQLEIARFYAPKTK